MSATGVAGGEEVQGLTNEAVSKRIPIGEQAAARFWTRAIRRRSADEDIRERPYELRHWMRYFGGRP